MRVFPTRKCNGGCLPCRDYEQSFDDIIELEPQNEWGRYGDYELVGHGEITDRNTCGKFRGFYGCLHTESHNVVTLDGHNHTGKVYVRKVFHSCDKPTCPVCYKRGWAVREAGNIESRIVEAEKRYGLAEHIVLSVPKKDYGLSYEALRYKAVKVMAARGIHGGCLIFHAFRYHHADETYVGEVAGWFWNPHFHVIGFIDGGYGRCRSCRKTAFDCFSCDGYEARTRRCFEKDGYIVVVLGKRKSIFGTAWYQLNHASVKRGVARFHVATWFGTCSYRRLKLKKGDRIRRDACPICGSDLVRLKYVGADNPLVECWLKEFEDSFLDERGVPKWVEAG
jgi:hypothetical protein